MKSLHPNNNELSSLMTHPAQKLERLYVTSPIRRYLHQPLVTRWFKRHLPPNAQSPEHVLDTGCGNGSGLIILRSLFPHATLAGIEIDQPMARAAQRNLHNKSIEAAVINHSITNAPYPQNTFHLITSHGCLHHIPAWEDALKTLTTLLSHNGCLALEEYYAPLIDNPLFKLVGSHPPQRFTHSQLIAAAQQAGLTLIAQRNHFNMAGLTLFQKQG